jgi:hypothetical protein
LEEEFSLSLLFPSFSSFLRGGSVGDEDFFLDEAVPERILHMNEPLLSEDFGEGGEDFLSED